MTPKERVVELVFGADGFKPTAEDWVTCVFEVTASDIVQVIEDALKEQREDLAKICDHVAEHWLGNPGEETSSLRCAEEIRSRT